MKPSRIEGVLPLAPLQEGLLFHALYDDRGPDLYTVQGVLDLGGPLNAAALRRAGTALLQRHANLRVSFRQTGAGTDTGTGTGAAAQAVQVVHRQVSLPWTQIDLSGLPADEQETALAELVERDRAQRFDLDKAPLIRCTLIRLAPDRHRFILTNHHILMDGWSGPLLWAELFALYGDPASLPPAVPYRDYLAWLARQDPQTSLTAWRAALAGVTEPTLLAPAHGDPQLPATQLITVPGEALTGLARRHGVTLNTVVQLGWAVLLGGLTGRRDVLFGATVSGRPADLPGVESMIGLFINTLPVRVRLDPAGSVAEHLLRVQDEQAALMDHQYLSLTDIQATTGLGELFDTLVLFESFPVDASGFATLPGGLRVLAADGHDATHYPLTLSVLPGRDLTVRLSYRTDLFTAAQIDVLAGRLTRLLAAMAADAGQPLARLDLLEAAETRQLLVERNTTARDVPPTTLPALFAAQAAATPDAVAVVSGDEQLTYRELDGRSSALAARLVRHGVGPERRVAVALPRGLHLPVALLAVHKAGGAYLPIDPEFPAARIADTLADARPALVLTTIALAGHLAGPAPVLLVDRADDTVTATVAAAVSATNPAYVIYTSGSTGRPKGVVITHHNLVNFLGAMQDRFQLTPDDQLLAVTTIAFDIAALELFLPLVYGASVVIADRDAVRDPALLVPLLNRSAATVMQATPSLWQTLLEHDPVALRGLRVLVGGEALPTDLAVALRAVAGSVTNLYGPTETTVWSTAVELDDRPGTPPIGAPVWNTQVYVLDAFLRPVPAGVPGELYIAGAGLARGYLNRPGLTAERFVADPYDTGGGRMYRTGDVVRWSIDGHLEYLGRSDFQVKIRGFRIELGEIETVLARHPAVTRAVVVAAADGAGDLRLVAYVVAPSTVDTGALRTLVAAALPEYMVPSAVVVLDALPLTANGKVDRKALPAPQHTGPPAGRAARTAMEELLCGLVAETLGRDRVGADDDFFALGGHSLLATRLVARIRAVLGVDVGVRAVFDAPTMAALAPRIAASDRRLAPLRREPRPGAVPLSLAQRRLWFLEQFGDTAGAYNLSFAARLHGHVDRAALAAAVTDLADRHEVLRTVFRADTQVLLPAGPALLSSVDAGAPFDLTVEPPIRVALDGDLLTVVLHHAAADGWSLGPFTRDLTTAYTARLRGEAPAWVPLPVQYADFALWQRDVLEPSGVLDRQLGFWRETLAGLPGGIALPWDRPRRAGAGGGAVVPVEIPAALHETVTAVARRYRVTVFMVLQAALAVTLSRWGAGTDVPVGTVVAGRDDEVLADLVGFFVNTLVLRTDVSGDPSFGELLGRVRDADLAAFGAADVPFERVVEALNPERVSGRHPLFQVMLAFQNTAGVALDLPGITATAEPAPPPAARCDLAFELGERTNTGTGAPTGIDGTLTYDTDLFGAGTAALIVERYVRVLGALAGDPAARIGAADLAGEQEHRMRLDWNDTARDTAPQRLPELIAGQAARTPDAIAVEHGRTRMTYRELDAAADRLARRLTAAGAGPERVVAVTIPRSPALVVAFLGVLRAGAAYLPIDPRLPAERRRLLLQDANPVIVLRDVDGPDVAATPQVADLEHPAYVIYTSGSTGAPKAVVVTHRGVVNMATAHIEALRLDATARVLQVVAPSFDPSIADLAMTLLCGATLVLPAETGQIVGADLTDLLHEQRISHVMLPSAVLATLPDVELPDLRSLVTGGDTCSPEIVGRWGRARALVNAYGPTETTVTATLTGPLTTRDGDGSPPIGRPIRNTRVHVLDDTLRPVPVGVPGELYIAGDGLARGYLGRPALTADRFVADPFGAPGARMYRTGDVARWRADGQLDFLGRVDHQVKLRGFRVEPGEVESALCAMPDVAQAAVIVHGERLAGYVVPQPGKELQGAALRADLAGTLPEHLVPASVTVLDALPLTAHGKLDRAALPAPDLGRATGGTYRAPGNHREELLCELFAEVLGVPRVGVDDNFFDLGGHSLLIVRLAERVRAITGIDLAVRSLFAAPTVAALAGRLGLDTAEDSLDRLLPLRAEGTGAPVFCLPPGPGIGWSYARLLRHVTRPVYALQARGLTDPDGFAGSMDDLVTDCLATIREVQPHGPYTLLGWSFGGVLGHALATRLRAEGEHLDALVMLDAYPGETQDTGEDSTEAEFVAALLGLAGRAGHTADAPTFAEAARHLREQGTALGALDERQLTAMHRVFRNHASIGERHTPAVYDGAVVFFRAALDGDQRYADTAAWAPYVAGTFEIHEISCHHYEMTQPGPIDQIGRVLSELLRPGPPPAQASETRSTA